MKQVISLALVLLLALGIAFWVFASRSFDQYLTSLPNLAQKSGVHLTITEPKLRLVGASSKKVEAFFVKTFTPLLIENITVDLPLLSLFGSPRAEYRANLYQGDFNGMVLYDNLDQKFTGQASLKSMALAAHPQLQSLGISKGKLDFNLERIVGDSQGLISANGQISIGEMDKQKDSTWSGSLFGQPGIIFLPKFADLALKFRFSLTLNDLKIPDFSLTSSLGKMQGQVRFQRSKSGTLKTPSGQFQFSLSQTGQTQIGPLLPIISNGQLNADVASAQISLLEDAQGKLKLDFTAISLAGP